MAKLNSNFQKIPKTYLFAEIAKRTKVFSQSNPGVKILKLGIGNTTEPIVPSVIKGLMEGVEKLSKAETYKGYGEGEGDMRLRKALSNWYKEKGIEILPEEIFISDGAKPDVANISSIFAKNSVVAITNPVYPVYRDANIISGKKIVYLKAKEENGFIPDLPNQHVDIIFFCSPNNPTGAVANYTQLKALVHYTLINKAIIIFDAAYSEYIQDSSLPKSIYEIKDAKKCVIGIHSFSKSAGFTGVRLGWSVVPMDLVTEGGKKSEVNGFWNRRQATMFESASNIVQEGGLAILSKEGQKQTHEQVKFYMENAEIIRKSMESLGLKVFGGKNAPYIWIKCPNGLSSWEFFDKLLNEAHVVCTPGAGFGTQGEGYVRLAAFGYRENIKEAVKSIQENLKL